ncbi:MAG: DNA-binding protein [Hyphococcus sp.]|nr:MAG: DNA-binding protein [Marinicaulis sp.]
MLRRVCPLTLPSKKERTEHSRERKCIATGVSGSPEGFIRFVLDPEGVVTPDFSGKLPGRGAWVSATSEALETALAKKAFSRSFKTEARIADELGDQVEAGLAKAALSALGLARRTGDVVTGFEKVRASLKDKRLAVLIAARDGAEDGKRKLRASAVNAALVGWLDEEELSAALGRDRTVHAGINYGPAADRFLLAARRLEGFRRRERVE